MVSSENNQNLRNSWEGKLTLVPSFKKCLIKILKFLETIKNICRQEIIKKKLCSILIKKHNVLLNDFINNNLEKLYSLINKCIDECLDDEYIENEKICGNLLYYIKSLYNCFLVIKNDLLIGYCDRIQSDIENFGSEKYVFFNKKLK